jgi:glycerol uptake facilitator-like aquaporin
MTHLLLVNYWGVLAATVAAFIFGNVYYIALGKHYAAAHGFTNEEMEAKYASPPIRQMIITFIATIIMSFMLYGILTHMPKFDMRNGAISALLIWIGFMATTIAVLYAYLGKSLKAWVIDSGHWFISLLIQGVILGWFGKA